MTATDFAARDSSVVQPLALPTVSARSEFVRYLVCSALALLVDLGLYWGCLKLGLSYPIAAAVGFCAGLFVAYTLSIRWAFQMRRLGNQRVEFAVFAAVGILGLGLTELLLWALIGQWGLSPLIAKIETAGGVFLFNFGLRKTLLFTRPTRRVAH